MKRFRLMKSITALAATGCALVLCATLPAPGYAEGNAAGAKIPAKIDINVQKMCPNIPGLPKDMRQVPGFSHEAHAREYLKGNEAYSAHPYTDAFTCAACHPGAKSEADILGQPECERLGKAFAAAGDKTTPMAYFHGTCVECHKTMAKAGKKTGPVSCKQCHGK